MKYGQKKQTNQITTMEEAFAKILAKSILEEGEAEQQGRKKTGALKARKEA